MLPVSDVVVPSEHVKDLIVEWRPDGVEWLSARPGEVDVLGFFGAGPARRVPNAPHRRNKIGWYWSSTAGAHLQFESDLEVETMRWLDWRPDVVSVVSQPFRLCGTVGTLRERRHVPDLLVGLVDGSFELIDVKPTSRLDQPRAQQGFALGRAFADSVEGCTFRVCSELPEPLRSNLRFGAQYRFDLDTAAVPAEPVLDALEDDVVSVGDVIDRVRGTGWSEVLPTVMHLAWHGAVVLDWESPIHEETEVRLPVGVEVRC